MRKPKNLDQYTDIEAAAAGLEKLARDIRNQVPGTLIRWNINLSFWHTDWEDKPKKAAK
jgi:hypothetical protein